MSTPQVGQLLVRQQRDVRVRFGLAQSLQPGVAITASPSQFTPRTRIFSTVAMLQYMPSFETDLPDDVLKVFTPLRILISTRMNSMGKSRGRFWGSARVLLRRDDDLGQALFAAVDRVQHFLLREAMVIGETFRIDQLGASPPGFSQNSRAAQCR